MVQPLNFRYPPGTAFSGETIGHAWKYGTFSSVTIGVVFEYDPSQRSLNSSRVGQSVTLGQKTFGRFMSIFL